MSPRYRCLLFGMACEFTTTILDALRGTDLELVGIVMPDRSNGSSDAAPRPKLDMPLHPYLQGRIDAVPRFPARSLHGAVAQERLLATAPDLIVAACFPWLIPPALVNAASIAAVNLHPSLLPRWRGPDPIAWALEAGDATTGITIHQLDPSYDTGPILAQREIEIAEGETLPELERRLAILGAELLVDLVRGLPSLPPARAQDEALATYAPAPRRDDSGTIR